MWNGFYFARFPTKWDWVRFVAVISIFVCFCLGWRFMFCIDVVNTLRVCYAWCTIFNFHREPAALWWKFFTRFCCVAREFTVVLMKLSFVFVLLPHFKSVNTFILAKANVHKRFSFGSSRVVPSRVVLSSSFQSYTYVNFISIIYPIWILEFPLEKCSFYVTKKKTDGKKYNQFKWK